MFESIINFFKNLGKKNEQTVKSKDAAKERLHLVLMQDRANVSADFLDLMKQEIIEVIKKYIDVDENAIDVRLTNKTNGDGTTGAPALYANIPIVSIKEEVRNKIARENDEKAEHIVPDKKEEKPKENDTNDTEKKEDNKNENKEEQVENNKEEIKEENKVKEQSQANDEEIKENETVENNTSDKETNSEEPKKEGEECEEQNS